jgi:hypothetical protein
LAEFANRKQGCNESLYQYAGALEQLAKSAGFGEAELMQRVIKRFVEGLADKDVKWELKRLTNKNQVSDILNVVENAVEITNQLSRSPNRNKVVKFSLPRSSLPESSLSECYDDDCYYTEFDQYSDDE